MQPIDKNQTVAEPSRMWLRWNRPCEGGEIATALQQRGFLMKKLSFAVVGAAALALAACGGKGDDTLSENIAENYDAAAENLEAAAENITNEADVLENQADALRTEGENAADATDAADVNAEAVNAM